MIAGTIEIQMLANMARLATDMANAKSSVTGTMASIEKSVKSAKSVLEALGIGLSAAYFVHLIKGSIDAADHLNDLSKSTNIAAEDLAGLKLLAAQSGTDLDGLAKGINKMSVEIGKDPEKFRALGVTAKDNVGAFKQFADIFNQLPDINQRNALAQAVFSKSWAELAPVLSEGGQHIGEIVTRGAQLSANTSRMSAEADALNDKWAELSATGGLLNRQVAPLLPLLNALADDLLKVNDEANNSSASFSPLAEAFRATVVLGGNLAFVFKGIGTEAGGMAAQLAALAHGDFKGFAEIGKQMKEDAAKARADFDAWEARMMQVGKGPAPTAPAATPNDPAAAAAAAARAAAFLATGQAASKEADRLRELDNKGWVAYIEAQTREYEDELAAQNKLLQDHNDEIDAARKKDDAGWVAYAEARVQADYEEAQQIAKQQIEAADESAKAQKEVWSSIEKTAHDSFVNIYKGGTDVFQRLTETLQNGLMEMLYQMTIKKWIIQLQTQMSGPGGSSGLGSIFDNLGSLFAGNSAGVNMGTATGADMAAAFADGGDHKGGLRMVGERGPELEATGPSRIFNAQQTKDILSGQGGRAVQITNAPVINVDARTDRAEVYTLVRRATQQGNEQLIGMLQQQGVLAS